MGRCPLGRIRRGTRKPNAHADTDPQAMRYRQIAIESRFGLAVA